MKKLKPHAVDWAQIDRFLASADKKLASVAKFLLLMKKLVFNKPTKQCSKLRWGSCSATDSVREVSLGTTSPSSISCVRAWTRNLLVVFDRLRRKRNMALYDDSGFVSHHEAEQALESAGDYLNVIRADIAARKP